MSPRAPVQKVHLTARKRGARVTLDTLDMHAAPVPKPDEGEFAAGAIVFHAYNCRVELSLAKQRQAKPLDVQHTSSIDCPTTAALLRPPFNVSPPPEAPRVACPAPRRLPTPCTPHVTHALGSAPGRSRQTKALLVQHAPGVPAPHTTSRKPITLMYLAQRPPRPRSPAAAPAAAPSL